MFGLRSWCSSGFTVGENAGLVCHVLFCEIVTGLCTGKPESAAAGHTRAGQYSGYSKRMVLQGRVFIVCLVVWGLLAAGFAAKCSAVARDSHYRIPAIVKT